MKSSQSYLILAVLFSMVTIANLLRIDFNAIKLLDIVPAILFGIASIIYIREFLKRRKAEKAKNG